MDDVFKPKPLILIALFSLMICVAVIYPAYVKNPTQITFCDVGQGDAAYLRLTNGKDILVDTGPGREVLDCLGTAMPPTDRYIDIVAISHPHLDHYGGLPYILEKYEVGAVLISPYGGNTQTFKNLIARVHEEEIPVVFGEAGLSMKLGEGYAMHFVWPPIAAVRNRRFAHDANAYSTVFIYEEGEFEVLFTGDVGPDVVGELQKEPLFTGRAIEILKVPHHGSDNGITLDFLRMLRPALSVISVGKNNRYNHPSPEVLDMFRAEALTYEMTAEKGHISMKVHPDGTFSQ